MSEFSFEIESPEPWQRVIKVTVPRAEYDRQYQQRLTQAVRAHQRPGFRKGKTPRKIVENEVGGRLRGETFEHLVPQAYRAAVIEHQLMPITEPQVENLSFEEGQDLGFDLRVEVRPEVTASDYEGLPVKERAVAVGDEEVQEVVERLRENRAVYERVDRPAQEDDQVTLDLVPREEDGSFDEERRLEGQKLVIGDERNLPAFNQALTGAEAGQDREIEVEYPAEYPNQAMAGRTVTFVCTIKLVETKVLPEENDAFASQLEEGQTLLELRGKIREGLEAEARRRITQELDVQILDGIIERNEVPVPPSMLESWLRSSEQDMRQRAAQMGQTPAEEEIARYREAARPVAERQIKGLFLLESVRRQESIEVSDEEIEEKIAAVAAENGFDLEKYREYVRQGDEKDRLRHGLEERKTYDFLLSRAQVESVPADAEIGPRAAEDRG